MDKINRIKELILILNKACVDYYDLDNPTMSDKEYDELYDELVLLENLTGLIMSNSPTQKVQGTVLDKFIKVKHTKSMLSANKTKDIGDIDNFIFDKESYASYKLDGLTLVVRYNNGKFIQAITRGNGQEGEDVSEQAKMITNLPLMISYKEPLELRGECVISWENFKLINEKLEIPYKHPRNLAAGSLRNLDSNITKERNLSFVVFECLQDICGKNKKIFNMIHLRKLGFETVEYVEMNDPKILVSDVINEILTPENSKYPVDGIIFEINDIEYSRLLGSTSHHENCRMAFKWKDDVETTTLIDVEWSASRTGKLNPVAMFKPIELDGTIVSRASLHNISQIKKLKLGIGDVIEVYKANMIIPQIHQNITCKNDLTIPNCCPVCGGKTEIRKINNSEELYCSNINCKAKLLGKLTHWCDKNSMNIVGLSEATMSLLIDNHFISDFKDLYTLKLKRNELLNLNGFGETLVDKLLDSIEMSRNTTLERFIRALGIPLIGKTQAKTISKYCKGKVELFINLLQHINDLDLDGIGDERINSLRVFNNTQYIEMLSTLKYVKIIQPDNVNTINILQGKQFVITGKLYNFKNRKELQSKIEEFGGVVNNSISSKIDYLINNEVNSNSNKNNKAKNLGLNIINETEFLNMINRKGE